MPPRPEAPVVLGRVMAPHGVRGWIKLKPYTAEPAGLLGYKAWLLGHEGDWREVELEAAREHGAAVVAKLAGVDDREAAALLRGLEVAVPRGSMPAPGADEYYWADLEGLAVVNREGEPLGRVERLLATGANDVLVVQGERERLIPFVAATILAVDLEGGTITVDWGADW